MQLLELQQGTDAWHEARAKHYCASEAPIIMGVSRHTKRTEFLAMKATGQVREFSDWVQRNLLDKGHEAEAKARPVVEAIIGEEFYPVVGVSECGRFLASFDGLTIDGSTGLECKLWNADLVGQIAANDIAEEYLYQMEHQCLVGELERVIFACSDGTEERTVWMEYRPDPARRAKLIAGWQQFEEDMKNYQHVEVLPAPVAKPVASLPALYVEIVGEVASSNLAAYKESALALIESVNTDLQTDTDFADAEAMVKFLDEAEKKVRLIKEQSLQKTASVAEAMQTMDDIAEAMRKKRLYLNKHVSVRKDSIRAEIKVEGEKAFAAHIAALNERLGGTYMPRIETDFAGAMRNKRTLASLRDAVNVALLEGKLAANAVADRISINLRTLEQNAEHRFLFNDAATLVQMDPQAFSAVVENRIAKHKAEQERKEAEAREAIRKEEEAKAAAKAKAEADAIAEQAREKIRAEERAKAEAEAKQRVAATKVTPSTAAAPAQPAARASTKTQSHVPPRSLPTPARAAPPRDEILMLVADKYAVPKTLAAKWLHELFAQENA